jgi:hypothetical protein
MTGQDLRQILLDKWGRSYDIQVLWKYQEQLSFPLSESEYLEHLDQVATYLAGWGAVEQVRSYIQKTRERPRQGKAVSIPIDLGDRASEWLLEDF